VSEVDRGVAPRPGHLHAGASGSKDQAFNMDNLLEGLMIVRFFYSKTITVNPYLLALNN
jgi:hypothetical protein